MTMGQRIKEARKRAGLTQKSLAVKIGVATGTVQQYELGKRQPRLEQIYNIADALNIPPEELLGLEHLEPGTDADKLLLFFDRLNASGRQKAIERVEELSEIPRYNLDGFTSWEYDLIHRKDTPPPEPPENAE